MRAAKGVLGLLTAALVLLSIGPLLLPFQLFPVLGSSMAPAVPAGSALLVTRVPASQLRVGDVVTFQPPGSDAFVTSRVYSLGPDLRTKPDAHSAPDPWRLSRQGSGWRAVGALPWLGYALAPVSDPSGRLLLVLLLGAAVAAVIWYERRRAPRPTTRRALPRSLLAVGALLLLTIPGTFAAFLGNTTNAADSFTNLTLASPTAPAASYTPSTVVLTWTAASPMNGNGYAISALNNGASSTCPSTVASYTTYAGSTASTTLTDLGSIAQGTPGTFACYLIQTAYNPAGAPPWAGIPKWTSLTSLATIAIKLGVQNVQIGALSAVQVTTVTGTLPVASTAGDLLVATLRATNSATQSTPPAGWSFAAGITNASANRTEIFYRANAPATTTASFTLPTGNQGEVQLSEWKNVSTATPLDKTGTFSTTTAAASGTVSTSAATSLGNELAIVNSGYGVGATTITPGAGWTSLGSSTAVLYAAQYRVNLPAAVSSETVGVVPNDTWAMVIATFK